MTIKQKRERRNAALKDNAKKWRKCFDKQTKRFYFVDEGGKRQWEPPEDFELAPRIAQISHERASTGEVPLKRYLSDEHNYGADEQQHSTRQGIKSKSEDDFEAMLPVASRSEDTESTRRLAAIAHIKSLVIPVWEIPPKYRIDPSEVDYSKDNKLGMGGQANVFCGEYKGKAVAIKIYNDPRALLKIPGFLGKFRDAIKVQLEFEAEPNVTTLVGACEDAAAKDKNGNPLGLCMLLEIAEEGSLAQLLNTIDPGTRKNPTGKSNADVERAGQHTYRRCHSPAAIAQ